MTSFGIDLAAGQQLARLEFHSDWYRDPWGWPELNHLDTTSLDLERDLGVGRRNRAGIQLPQGPAFCAISVPKNRLGTRPGVVIDPLSRLIYLSATASVLRSAHSDLPEWVYGWRGRDGELSTGNAEWQMYLRSLPTFAQAPYAMQTDVTSCFASMSLPRVERALRDRIGATGPTSLIMQIVEAHDGLGTRRGLPQRSFGSSILAHVVLQPLDDELQYALDRSGVVSVRRWMDDISAEGDEDSLYSLLLRLQDRARQIGLELNASKTHLSPCSERLPYLWLEDLKEIDVPWREHVADEYTGETALLPDLDKLEELESSILADPRRQLRPVVSAVLNSLARHGYFERAMDWMRAAIHIPASADRLAGYLRGAVAMDAITISSLADWFQDYERSAWGRVPWTTTTMADSFPEGSPPGVVVDIYRRWLTDTNDVLRLSTAMHKVALTDAAFAGSSGTRV